MARGVFQHELQDADFSWLITRFQEQHASYVLIESPTIPLVLVKTDELSPYVPQSLIDLTEPDQTLPPGDDN